MTRLLSSLLAATAKFGCEVCSASLGEALERRLAAETEAPLAGLPATELARGEAEALLALSEATEWTDCWEDVRGETRPFCEKGGGIG